MALSKTLIVSLAVLAAAAYAQTQESKKEQDAYSDQQGRAPRAFYTASWAVEILGGAKMAEMIAGRNGFVNLGEVFFVIHPLLKRRYIVAKDISVCR